MAQTEFKFNSASGESFIVVSFNATEGLSQLYRYEIELKAPLSRAIDLDEILDNPATFISVQADLEYPVHGILASFDEMQTAQGYVYYKAVLVPTLWKLSIYKTNEIYTAEKTVNLIIQTVLENAGFSDGTDFDLGMLETGNFLQRDYICQFGESDFDFISRLMQNEGIFYYFDHSGTNEKIIFINNASYVSMDQPDMVYEIDSSKGNQHRHISSWTCRKQRLPESISIRDYNSNQPSLDISDTVSVDTTGSGIDYQYGGNIMDSTEASFISEIRAQELKSHKTRFYGESSVSRFQSGYSFAMDKHPNEKYNTKEYLLIEVSHEGTHLDSSLSGRPVDNPPQYHNSFVAIESIIQFRPPLTTPKPRFYGTMTAFIYAESITGKGVAEVDEQGRYRVHLPFDRADGTKDSNDPDRKSSTWIRMAQPYVGENEGMYFPLEGGTEVLLTFINGDPDQPIISAALPNASTPSLLNSETAHMASIVTPGAMVTKSYGGSYTNKSIYQVGNANQASASTERSTAQGYGAQEKVNGKYNGHFMPPSDFEADAVDPNDSSKTIKVAAPLESDDTQFPFYKLNDFGQAKNPDDADYVKANEKMTGTEETTLGDTHIDRGAGPQYVHRVGSTFAYPQQERVYFCGTFHEDFHMDDMGIIGKKRERDAEWKMTDVVVAKAATDPQGDGKEVFHFPEPGKDGAQDKPDPNDNTRRVPFTADELETKFPPNRVRGVSEDKRWGDQMNYAWGRSFNWAGGPAMGGGDTGSFATINYGNGYTENLQTLTGGTSHDTNFPYTGLKDQWDYTAGGTPSVPFNIARVMAPISIGLSGLILMPIKGAIWAASMLIHESQNELSGAWQLNPATTAVDKTFGHKYEYHMGLSVGIHEGNSISKTYGHSAESINGNSESYVWGDSISTTGGTSSEAFLGSKYEFNFGTADTLTIAANTDTFIGLQTELCLAGKFVAELSATTGINAAKDFRTDLFEDKAAAKATEAAIDKNTNAINDIEKSLSKMTHSMMYRLTTTGLIQFKSGTVDIIGALAVSINGTIVKLG